MDVIRGWNFTISSLDGRVHISLSWYTYVGITDWQHCVNVIMGKIMPLHCIKFKIIFIESMSIIDAIKTNPFAKKHAARLIIQEMCLIMGRHLSYFQNIFEIYI
ncbi:hypothetical protein CHS0354_021796 [Potamilus streckersoni]|uniref:Uncharacterized protein n=1 Tax=Potamilus streckersoni TaxID=2493646 RepID=A0AAE0S462_9BIVA|nr:hypothetical protein CHS0354_021796 [Potamilus streckersoni]